MMRIIKDNIVLRDYEISDIEDEIRWTSTDTAWYAADTPWITPEPVNPDQLRAEMLEIITGLDENAIRWRFEIEVSGRHIGFVSSYFPDSAYDPCDRDSVDPGGKMKESRRIRALGIEICEPDDWGKGIGTKALAAFMDYYRQFGETCFLLETRSENARMLGCAGKLGFAEARRTKAAYTVNGTLYDALILEKHFGSE